MTNKRMQLIGDYDTSIDAENPFHAKPCLQSTNRSLFEAPYFFGYICEDDVFDESGKVKIRVRNHYECEVLQLNRTFAEKYHLHNEKIAPSPKKIDWAPFFRPLKRIFQPTSLSFLRS